MRNNCEYWTLPLFIVSLTFTLVLCLDSHCQKRKQSAQLEMVVPAGYRLLEYGEKIRSGDKGWYKGWYKEYDWVYYDMDFDKGFGNESKICNFAIRKIHY